MGWDLVAVHGAETAPLCALETDLDSYSFVCCVLIVPKGQILYAKSSLHFCEIMLKPWFVPLTVSASLPFPLELTACSRAGSAGVSAAGFRPYLDQFLSRL